MPLPLLPSGPDGVHGRPLRGTRLSLLAASGAEALEELGRHQEAIRLLVTDVVMPFMDGIALTRALRRVDPKVHIVASSARISDVTDSNRVAELSSLGVKEFLQKPYQTEELGRLLRTLLSRESSHS